MESGHLSQKTEKLPIGIVVRTRALSTASSPEHRNKGNSMISHAQTRRLGYNFGIAAQPAMAAQSAMAARSPGRESASTMLVRDTCPLTRAAWRGGLRVHRRTSEACHRRKRWGDRWHREVFKERLLQVISIAIQAAISRRVQRFKLSLRGRQQEEGRRAGLLASNTSIHQ